MWRSIFAVVLLPVMAAAQAELPKPNPMAHANSSYQSAPKLLSFRSFNQLRQGTDERIAVQLQSPGMVTSPRAPVPGIVPLSLELKPAEGIALGPLDYPQPFKHKFAYQGERIAAFELSWQHIEFKAHAASDAAPGLHLLTGTLKWQVIGDAGVFAPQQMDVQIPVNVVERTAKVSRATDWPSQDRTPPWGDMPIAEKIVLVPLLPLLILISGLVCAMRGEDCRC